MYVREKFLNNFTKLVHYFQNKICIKENLKKTNQNTQRKCNTAARITGTFLHIKKTNVLSHI